MADDAPITDIAPRPQSRIHKESKRVSWDSTSTPPYLKRERSSSGYQYEPEAKQIAQLQPDELLLTGATQHKETVPRPSHIRQRSPCMSDKSCGTLEHEFAYQKKLSPSHNPNYAANLCAHSDIKREQS